MSDVPVIHLGQHNSNWAVTSSKLFCTLILQIKKCSILAFPFWASFEEGLAWTFKNTTRSCS